MCCVVHTRGVGGRAMALPGSRDSSQHRGAMQDPSHAKGMHAGSDGSPLAAPRVQGQRGQGAGIVHERCRGRSTRVLRSTDQETPFGGDGSGGHARWVPMESSHRPPIEHDRSRGGQGWVRGSRVAGVGFTGDGCRKDESRVCPVLDRTSFTPSWRVAGQPLCRIDVNVKVLFRQPWA